MSLFQARKSLTYLFIAVAVLVAFLSLILSNSLVNSLAEEERSKIEIWAMATESIAAEGNIDLSLVLKIMQSNSTIPVVLYDKSTGELQSHNIKLPGKNVDQFLRDKADKFSQRHAPITLHETNQILYYDDSYTLKQLQIYPYIQLIVIALFVGLAFFALNRSGRAEQNRVWVGLSKETAHQLGTPISSLMAWLEYLKLKNVDPELLADIEKDVNRLEVISDRFSKIGTDADLVTTDFNSFLQNSLEYMRRRISTEVEIISNLPDHPVMVPLNEPLFSWVIENLTKNAVDAMQGKGTLTFSLSEEKNSICLDIIDTGKGIPKSKFKTIFSPGYTTKERGWGLGLSLVKRIVEVSHNGKIFVKESEIAKGTAFRVKLRKR